MSRNLSSGREAGFALIVALMALMLLTFLGLTLSATTSTELQISNNYRWGQQALYNAEAGLEAARAILRTQGDGQPVLPTTRTTPWVPTGTGAWTPTPPGRMFAPRTRDFEGSACDRFGNGVGFGEILSDPFSSTPPIENANVVFGQRLNGGVTVWVRREFAFAGGMVSDSPAGENVVVTAEGTAPYAGTGTAFQAANRAIRRLESHVRVREGCNENKNQAGGFRGCQS